MGQCGQNLYVMREETRHTRPQRIGGRLHRVMLPGYPTEKEGHIDEKENRYILSRYDGCRRSLRFCSQPLRRRTE